MTNATATHDWRAHADVRAPHTALTRGYTHDIAYIEDSLYTSNPCHVLFLTVVPRRACRKTDQVSCLFMTGFREWKSW